MGASALTHTLSQPPLGSNWPARPRNVGIFKHLAGGRDGRRGREDQGEIHMRKERREREGGK